MKLILLFVLVAVSLAAEPAKIVPASHPHPSRIVAKKQFSNKLFTESKLRHTAKKIKTSANKLMGAKASDLIPTWSTTSPEIKGKTTKEEGNLNVKHRAHVDHQWNKDDKNYQAHTSNK